MACQQTKILHPHARVQHQPPMVATSHRFGEIANLSGLGTLVHR